MNTLTDIGPRPTVAHFANHSEQTGWYWEHRPLKVQPQTPMEQAEARYPWLNHGGCSQVTDRKPVYSRSHDEGLTV